jgi:hypothetical protein
VFRESFLSFVVRIPVNGELIDVFPARSDTVKPFNVVVIVISKKHFSFNFSSGIHWMIEIKT